MELSNLEKFPFFNDLKSNINSITTAGKVFEIFGLNYIGQI